MSTEWLIDYIVLFGYLIGITVIGALSAKRVKNSSTFFMSERNFGKLMMTFFNFGTGTSTDQAVTTVAKTYTVGAGGIWYQWLWIFSTPFYWLLAPLFRRMRAVTTSDFLRVRYGQSVSILFAITGMLQLSVLIGVVLKASSAMIEPVTGGAINADVAIFGMTALFVIYGVAGGLRAAVITDFIQGILTIVLSFLILPFALKAVGGIAGLRETINDPAFFELVSDSPRAQQLGIFYVIVISINALIGWVTAPHVMQMCGAGKTEHEARVGLVVGMLLKRACTIAWVLTGMVGIGMYMGTDMHQNDVWGSLAREFLPQISPGLIGLFIASVLAAVMSSCDCFMVAAAALFVQNIYKPLIRPDETARHYLLMGRIASFVIVLGGIVIAFELEYVVAGLELLWSVQAMMGISIWASFVWRRATAAAAWASTISGFVIWFFTSTVTVNQLVIWDFNARFAHLLPRFMTTSVLTGDAPTLQLSLPWQMVIYLSIAIFVMIVVSLTTKPRDKATLDRVYETLRTPISPGEPEVEPVTLPEGTKPAPRSVLIDHPDFEIQKPTASTVLGFLAAWGAVGFLIALFAWIIS